MAREREELVFVGIKNAVLALNRRDGSEVWRAKLKGSSFVTVLWDGDALLAANHGEVFRLDPANGSVVWHNPMKGLGFGVVSLAALRAPAQSTLYEPIAEQKRREAAAKAAAGAAG